MIETHASVWSESAALLESLLPGRGVESPVFEAFVLQRVETYTENQKEW